MKFFPQLIFGCLLVSLLSACGGASPIESETIPQPQLNSPSIEVDLETAPTIALDQISVNGANVEPTSILVKEGDQISISVSALDADNTGDPAAGITDFAWIQYQGTATQLSSSDTAVVEFKVPRLPDESFSEPLSMQVTARDDDGSFSQLTVSLVVTKNTGIATLQFPDPILASCVELETLEQGVVSAQYLTELDCSSFADRFCINSSADCLITDLTDIDQLTQLESVNLSNNNISNVSPLGNLPLLDFASLQNNPIQSLVGIDVQRVAVEVSPVIVGLPDSIEALASTKVSVNYHIIDPIGDGEFLVGQWTASIRDFLFQGEVDASELPQELVLVAPEAGQEITMTLTVSKFGHATEKSITITSN